jgi:hypothetical protein
MKRFAAAMAFAALGCNSPSGGGQEPATDITGTWAFDVESSDVAAELKKDCSTDACWNDIREKTRLEKMRFAKDAEGHTRYTSFGIEDGKEVIWSGGRVEGWIPVEVVDTKLVIHDPRKGRLVYTKE